MPTFHYTAKRGPRDVVEGVLEAENRPGALIRLTELGYTPVRVSEQTDADQRAADDGRPAAIQSPAARVGRVPAGHITVFTRQFASLVRSHVPLLRALKILEDQARHPALRQVLRGLAEEVRQGQTISSGLAKFPSAFSPLYVNLVHSGEVSGALDVILERLATQLEQEQAMRSRVRAALTYPAFVGVVGCATVVFLMTFVMPRLSRLLTGLGERLPLPTRLLLAVSEWMSSGWFWGIVMGAAIALAVLWRIFGRRGRVAADRLLLRIPLLGALVRQSEVARFARSFGLQIDHGIPILQAIDVAVQVVNHTVIRSQLQRVPEGLRQGNTLSSCLKELQVGTPFLVNTIAVGEESGRVGEALLEVAAYDEREVERLLQTLSTLLEPMLILLVGLVVGFIVMAVLLPIFEMSAINL